MASRAAKKAKDVYRGYMPIDLPQHRPPRRIKPWWKVAGRPTVTLYPKQEIEGYSDEPEYPPLNDGSRAGVRNQVRLDWYESLKSLPTSEQKLHEIGRHCEHYMAHINNWLPACSSLDMVKYLTQTNLIDSLPDNYKHQVQADDHSSHELLDQVKQIILDQIALDKYESTKASPSYISKSIADNNREAHVSNLFIQNLVGSVKKVLAVKTNPQLLDYHFDLSPAIRSWWYHSGVPPPNGRVFYKSRKDEDGNINQLIQMNGSAALSVRHDSMIEPIMSQTDSSITDTELVPKFCHPLKHYGAIFKFKRPVALPGFWFEEEPKFDNPHTCFLSTDCLRVRNGLTHKVSKAPEDDENCLNSQAILTAYGWLNSLSMYHGYTPFQELDYPFTCQVVTTDGQNWLFNVYQLNCHTFHRDLGRATKNNICWSSGKMRLYEEYVNGKFEGVNNDVVKFIVRFLSQKTSPEYTSQLNLRPYLGVDTRTQDEKEAMRKELRRTYEQRSNRWLSHDWKVPLWEHIFFRAPEGRNKRTDMKARWHIPKPLYPKIFE